MEKTANISMNYHVCHLLSISVDSSHFVYKTHLIDFKPSECLYLSLMRSKQYPREIMPNNTYYRQCLLSKQQLEQTSWIPEQYAIKGKILKIKDNGVWVNGWIVGNVGERRIKEWLLPNPRLEVKQHRKATGDSLPKVRRE